MSFGIWRCLFYKLMSYHFSFVRVHHSENRGNIKSKGHLKTNSQWKYFVIFKLITFSFYLNWILESRQIVIESTRIIIQYSRRAFRLHKTHQWRSYQKKYKATQVQSWRPLRIQNTQKVVPNTAKVIYSWDKKILSFSKKSKFCTQEIY